MRTSKLGFLLCAIFACGGPPAAAPPLSRAAPPPTMSSAEPAPATSAPATPPPAPTPWTGASPATPPKPRAPEVKVLAFERLLEGSARSLALGKKGRAAVLKDEPWRFDGEAWKVVPIPAALRAPDGATDEVHIYFGRDNRMRMMGTRTGADEVDFVYWRFKNGWREGHREIGSLANQPHNGLFGILGWDDPEVVCKVGDICIIKRLTGWTIIKSGPGSPAVVIAQQSAWALHDDHIAEVGKDGWKKLGPLPFSSPRGLWADPDKKLWVSAGDALHHHDGKTWTRHVSPVKAPKAIWGSGPQDVWVAGGDGAAHFDGKSWRKVAGLSGPLSFVLGREDEVWLAGASGTWRGQGKRS